MNFPCWSMISWTLLVQLHHFSMGLAPRIVFPDRYWDWSRAEQRGLSSPSWSAFLRLIMKDRSYRVSASVNGVSASVNGVSQRTTSQCYLTCWLLCLFYWGETQHQSVLFGLKNWNVYALILSLLQVNSCFTGHFYRSIPIRFTGPSLLFTGPFLLVAHLYQKNFIPSFFLQLGSRLVALYQRMHTL